MKKIIYILLLSMICASFQAQTIRYVKQGAGGNGSSWADASGNLQKMINESGEGDSVFVAKGTYTPIWTASGWNSNTSTYPTTNENEDNAFVMKKDVWVFGGFNDSGNPTFLDRNWKQYTTILSGSNTCYHVVVAVGEMGDAKLDGFTITGGIANNTSGAIYINGSTASYTVLRQNGGGISCRRTNMHFENLIIQNNKGLLGGGLYVTDPTASGSAGQTITCKNVSFIGNSAINSGSLFGDGGGLYAATDANYISVAFKNNVAKRGAAVFVDNSKKPKFANVVITGNKAEANGSTLGEGGAVYACPYSMPTFVNATIAGNYAKKGGGCYGQEGTYPNSGAFLCINTIIWGNKASSDYDNVNQAGTYNRCLVEGEDNSYWQNMNLDPLFINPVSASSAPNTNGDYRVQQLSPAINSADTTLYKQYAQMQGGYPWLNEKDMNYNTRLVYNDLDLGAFEMQDPIKPDTLGRVYVKQGGSGTKNGSSWANSYPDFTDILHYTCYHNYLCTPNDSIKEIWVTQTQEPYKPKYTFFTYNGSDRDKAFVLPEGVKIYGGFRTNANDAQDTAISVRGNSLGTITPTILSGDIGTVGNNNDNSYHVVVATNITGNQTIVLDGFKIIDGNANGSGSVSYREQDIPRNCGGGICVINSSSSGVKFNEFKNLIIENNKTSSNGGGVYNGGNCSAKFRNIIIRGNSANNGGGIYNKSKSEYSQIVVSGNLATTNGGGVMNENCTEIIKYINVTIAGNKAGTNGGGLYNNNSNPTFQNSVISNNNTSVFNNSATPAFKNCLVEGSGGSGAANWNISFGSDLTGNIGSEAKFIDFIDPNDVGFAATTSGEFRLKGNSPAIDKGSNSDYQNYLGVPLNNEVDIIGTIRVSHSIIDMGAYETIVFDVSFSGINVSIPTQHVALNDHVELPEEPTRPSFFFAGWFTDNGIFLNQWDFQNYVITQDTTLYVKWASNPTFTVTFAGETINIPPQYIETGHFAIEPTTPIRSDYTFLGWFTDDVTFTNQWNFNENAVNENITLYAKWTPYIGLTELQNEIILVYPNPSSDYIYIKGIKNNTSVEILDIAARVIQKFNISETNLINIENLAPGIYIIKINEIKLKFIKN